MTDFYQLAYYSRNTIYGEDAAYNASIYQILQSARRNNTRNGITGFLLVDKSWFFQILEGDKKNLSETISRIQVDRRHTGVTIIQNRPILTRSFDNWLMGCSIRTPEKFAIYQRHGVGAVFDPRILQVEDAISLAYELSILENDISKQQHNPANRLNPV